MKLKSVVHFCYFVALRFDFCPLSAYKSPIKLIKVYDYYITKYEHF